MNHGIKCKLQSIVDVAFEFAEECHRGQVRKYTGEPYINHPVEVARIVAEASGDAFMIAGALLHDVMEDCGVSREEIELAGLWFTCGDLVEELTDISKPSDGNRATRKEIDRQHLAKASDKAKTIKLADLISNSKSIIENDPEFAKVYMREKELLLEVLIGGDETLYARCVEIVNDYKLSVKKDTL